MRLESFNNIPLPDNNAQDELEVAWRSNLRPMRNGSIDLDGSQSYLESVTVGRDAYFTVNIDDGMQALLREFTKGRGILRARMRDNSSRITFAKARSFSHPADVNNYECYAPYTVRFEQDYPYWMDERDGGFISDGGFLDDGTLLDWPVQSSVLNTGAAFSTFNIVNAGNAPVSFMFIEVITSAASTLTAPLKIMNLTNQMEMDYSGNLAASQALRIDPLSRRIEKDYSNVYSGFSVPNALQTDWFRLEIGTNAIRVEYTAATGTVTVKFHFLRHYL